MKINWKKRLRNKPFLVSLFALALLVIQQVALVFGVNVEVLSENLTRLFEAVLTVLILGGIITNPTTKGFADNEEEN